MWSEHGWQGEGVVERVAEFGGVGFSGGEIGGWFWERKQWTCFFTKSGRFCWTSSFSIVMLLHQQNFGGPLFC